MQIGPDLYPDFHFLLIAPNLGAEWLFDAARRYWERFRPTIISDFTFLPLIPPDRTITVTVIAMRDMATEIAAQLRLVAPNAYYDPVVYDLFDQVKAELDRRAMEGQPFGVPMSQPTPTIDPASVFIPTPRMPATNPPAGYVTETPSPAPTIPSFTPPDSTQAPITATPGPIIGGG